MKKFSLAILGIAFLAVAITTSVTGYSGIFNKIADTVLANEVRFDDLEAPSTPYAIAASADGVQVVGGQGNGLSCSLPPGAQALAFSRGAKQAPIALQMRQACAFHDYCYRHGNATYGYSQADCDFMLQQQAFRLCKFINRSETIETCETNARKVTLGVRMGGFGSFKRARSLEDKNASTFLEFDPYPVRASTYRVVRIADAPRLWVRDGLLPKAAYHFTIRPSGSLVDVLGWKPDGSMVCSSFELPASYNAINGPPMVVRNKADGEDWFVWWKRRDLTSTYGYFALLPPGRATQEDWSRAAGGFMPHLRLPSQCEYKALWETGGDVQKSLPLAFRATPKVDLDFSELHPVNGVSTSGFIQLMGLSTHSCNNDKKDHKLCLVEVVFDIARRQFRNEPASPTRYRVVEHNCGNGSSESCDRYRNFVGAPFVVEHESSPSLVWMRRGAGNGDGYTTEAKVRRYTIGKTRADPATDLGEMVLTTFPEAMEPAFITNAASTNPTFVSLVAGKDGFKLITQTAIRDGEQSTPVTLECFGNPHTSWLQRPTFLVQNPKDTTQSYMVFSRVRLNDIQNKEFAPSAALEVAVKKIANGSCSDVQESTFPAFFKSFATSKELSAMTVTIGSGDKSIALAEEAFSRFAERVRGGQTVLADITGDGVPDLVQIAWLPDALHLRAGFLLGNIDAAGLRFHEFTSKGPVN